jgi:ribonuclease HII
MKRVARMTTRIPKSTPDLNRERRLWRQGFIQVAGLDEVGRGAWAGPLAAAAVVLPSNQSASLRARLSIVQDSKMMTPSARCLAAILIREVAAAWSIGAASAAEVDQCGPVAATRLAMQRALCGLCSPPDYLLIDFLRLPESSLPQLAFPHGDMLSLSIAAASVIAKVWRDEYMRTLDRIIPGYGFGAHKGYGTRQHVESLARLGVSAQHRMSYAPIRRITPSQVVAEPV